MTVPGASRPNGREATERAARCARELTMTQSATIKRISSASAISRSLPPKLHRRFELLARPQLGARRNGESPQPSGRNKEIIYVFSRQSFAVVRDGHDCARDRAPAQRTTDTVLDMRGANTFSPLISSKSRHRCSFPLGHDPGFAASAAVSTELAPLYRDPPYSSPHGSGRPTIIPSRHRASRITRAREKRTGNRRPATSELQA